MKRRTKNEGTIYWSKTHNLWVAQISLPDGKRKTKYGKTQAEVKNWLLEKRKALSDGLLVKETNATVSQFLDRWFEEVARHKLKPSTLISHESIIRNHIKPTIGNIKLTKLKPAHLQSLYSEKLNQGLSKRTVYYIHTIMHQLLDQAVKWGLVARNVSNATDPPRPKFKKVEPLTKDQIERLFNVLTNDRLYPYYVLLLGCGLRRGEALALTLDDVDLDKGLVNVNKTLQHLSGMGFVIDEPKSEKSRRIVALPEYAREVLAEHLANREVESEYVFATSNGTPFIPRHIVRHFKSSLKKAGLPKTIRVHDLRHTFVSLMLSANVPPKDVQEIVGHASFSTTVDIYGHLMAGAQKEAAKKMDKFFEEFNA